MNYQIRKIIIALGIFATFLIFYYLGWLTQIEKIFTYIFDMNQVKIVKLGSETNKFLNYSSASKSELLQQTSQLQSQINDLNAKILQFEQIEKENQKLTRLLGFKKTTDYNLIVGQLTHVSNSVIEKSVVINKGKHDGIIHDAAVIIGDGILIGKVDQVNQYKSTVKLTINKGTHILASLAGLDHNIAGVLVGRQENALSLDLIPKNISIMPGQKVITNGLQENIPAYLYLGEVIKLQESPNEIFTSALVQVPYTFEDLTIAAVIIPNNS